MQFIEINIQADSSLQEILIALMSESGFSAFEQEEDLLKAVISIEQYDENELDKLVETFSLTYSKSIIEERNWNALWEADFEPISICTSNGLKKFAYIRASFHLANNEFEHDIIITPKMSFGTGHHPTTHLMIEAMREIDFAEKDVIDFGTGTGVLAILAEKLHAARILAVDCDDWSIRNAAENIEENGCSRISLDKTDSFPAQLADVILANINLNIIAANLENMFAAAKKNAVVLLSGMLRSDENEILSKVRASGFEAAQIYYRENWLAIKLVKK